MKKTYPDRYTFSQPEEFTCPRRRAFASAVDDLIAACILDAVPSGTVQSRALALRTLFNDEAKIVDAVLVLRKLKIKEEE